MAVLFVTGKSSILLPFRQEKRVVVYCINSEFPYSLQQGVEGASLISLLVVQLKKTQVPQLLSLISQKKKNGMAKTF